MLAWLAEHALKQLCSAHEIMRYGAIVTAQFDQWCWGWCANGAMWQQRTLPHLGQSPLMTKIASSLASSSAAVSPLKRLDALVGFRGSRNFLFSFFFGGGLQEDA